MEGLDDDDSLESVLDEIPHQVVAWMNTYDAHDQEPFWMEGGGCSGNGNDDFSTHHQFGASTVSSVGLRPQNGVGDNYLCPKSASMPPFGGGRNNNDEEELCTYMNRMAFRDRDDGVDLFNGFPFQEKPACNNTVYDFNGCNNNGYGGRAVPAAGYLGYCDMRMLSPGFQKRHFSDNLFSQQLYPITSDPSFPRPPMGGRYNNTTSYTFPQQVSLPSLSNNTFNGVSKPDVSYYAPMSRLNYNGGGDGILEAPNHQRRPIFNIASEQQCRSLPIRFPMPLNAREPLAGLQDINSEGSFILQGQGMSPLSNKNIECLRKRVRGFINNASEGSMPKGRHAHHVRTSKIPEQRRSEHMCIPAVIPQKLRSLSEVCGQLPDVAKHQTQCRLLQDIIEQRDPQAIQAIFDEIIEHVVELMINPFGNYFMQKLLDVCSEEQRTMIIDVAAKEPGVLVQVSLNDHGTRVIQKLIDTAKTREQILKIVSALEPGFYALITDSNGNHVIERCLHCFTYEQNKFIFVAATDFCIEIATDQYGCCVLQKCISHSTGEYQDRLVAEISNNAFLLSQDAFGNYAVQFILDMKNPQYTSRLISQLQGNYVHLAMQKCSSHVVEKCLKVFNSRNKSQLINELVSFNHFEQLLQDPHANYVIQTALKVSEGAIHQRLVRKIELYRAISCHSPYCKRIFSSKKKKR